MELLFEGGGVELGQHVTGRDLVTDLHVDGRNGAARREPDRRLRRGLDGGDAGQLGIHGALA